MKNTFDGKICCRGLIQYLLLILQLGTKNKKAAKNLCEWFFEESFNNMFEEDSNEKKLENE